MKMKRKALKNGYLFGELPILFSKDTVEPYVYVQERMVKTINNIVKQHPLETVCIVSHSIALQLLMDYFENKALENLWSSPAIPSTSLTLVKINSASNEILFKYDTSHMEEKYID